MSMADEDASALTAKEKVQGAIVLILMSGAMALALFLLSWLTHSDVLVPHPHVSKAASHGSHGAASGAAAQPHGLPLSSPWYWVFVVCSLGLSALPPGAAAGVGAIVGFLYGAEAALLASYNLGNPVHWICLLVDWTWSLPNTIFGFAIGNPIYLIKGSASRSQSRAQAWISFSGYFGTAEHKVLQTLGTLNLGGSGAHERTHLLQARLLGPAYLPLQLASYIVNGTLQILWTCTLGWILYLTKVRDSAWFRPPDDSAVKSSGAGDFFGWIYRYTLMELWGYASE
jgi:hypothetical protein